MCPPWLCSRVFHVTFIVALGVLRRVHYLLPCACCHMLVAICLLPYACCHVLVAICLLPSHDHLLWVGMSEPFLSLLQLQEILTKNGLKLHSVIEFAIEDDLLVKRITGRYALWLTSNLGQLLWRLKEPGYDRGVGNSVHC